MTADSLILGLILLAPVLVVVVTAIVVLLIDLVVADWVSRRPLMWIATLGLLVGVATCGLLWLGGYVGKTAFGGFLVLDGFALFFEALFLLTAMLVILSATTFADREELVEAEFYIMVLFSTAGLMLMASGNELMSIYLAIEVTSLSLAFLAAWNKRDVIAGQGLKSTEAGIKFFLLSAMSTAVLLYGMALLYGVSGATTLVDISRVLTGTPSPAALLSVTMLVAGLGFKIAAAPFQLWTPDVYQGAATPATAFFSVGSKAAGLRGHPAHLQRRVAQHQPRMGGAVRRAGVRHDDRRQPGRHRPDQHQTPDGVFEHHPRRLHADRPRGGQCRRVERGDVLPAGVRVHESRRVHRHHDHGQLRARRRDLRLRRAGAALAVLAMGLTVALLSLAGIPPFVGFFAKLYLFLTAIRAGSVGLQLLVIWALIMSAVSLYYYGRVIHAMWMRDAVETAPVRPASFSQGLALAASLAGVVAFGIFAPPFLNAAVAASSIFGH